MVSDSPDHATICTNLVAELYRQPKGGRCQAWSKDFIVRSGPVTQNRHTKKGLYSYPNLIVFCCAPVFHDDHRDALAELG